MKVAVYRGKNRIDLEEIPEPLPGPGQLRVRVLACGICGSDLHVYTGKWKAARYAGGHEICGLIEAVGEGVKRFSPGDRVAALAFRPCGSCGSCASGRVNLCDDPAYPAAEPGGFAEVTLVEAVSAVKLPGDFPARQGALVEPAAVAVRAVRKALCGGSQKICIVGAGTIGLLSIPIALKLGAREVFVVARHPQQKKVAAQLGASDCIEEKEALSLRADACIATVATTSGLKTALESVKKAGTVVLVGGVAGPLLLHLGGLVGNELNLMGSNCYTAGGQDSDFNLAIQLVRAGVVPAESLITHTFKLDEVGKAFQTAGDKGTGSVKVVVEP